jgi:hypothetical protein
MKKCSTSLALKEMQIKSTLRFHLIPVRMAIIKTQTTTKVDKDWGEGTLIRCCWECKLVKPLWKTAWSPLEKLKIELPYDPGIPLPKEYKPVSNKGTCTPMFIATLFTIANLWKQPKYPTTDKRIKTIWYLYTIEFYFAIKKDEILLFASKWMELQSIMKLAKFRKTKCICFAHM